jgi:hypothetical protein
MCQRKNNPSKCTKGKDPRKCSPEQVKECHPEGGHPCEEKPKKKAKNP